jgi:hypothetical protein
MEENEKNIAFFLRSPDPLSCQVLDYLILFKEEDSFVDYKVSFDPNDEKEWLEVTKDVMAFANSNGGYIVFGVENGTFDPVGLDKHIADALADTDKFQQKINRYIKPDIKFLRSKLFPSQGKYFVIIYIPETIGATHMVSKDGTHKFPNGKEKIILKQGTFYIRRSGGNRLGDSGDFEDIVSKRIEIFKESILGKIARVVEAPRDSEILVVSRESNSGMEYKFRIDNATGSIPIKGMSFSISPETYEEEIACWIAMWRNDPAAIPPSKTLWRWYENRLQIILTEDQRLRVTEFSMTAGVPFFFWLRGIDRKHINKMLQDAAIENKPMESIENFLGVSAIVGESAFKKMINRIERHKTLSPFLKRPPLISPKEKFHQTVIESRRRGSKKIPESQFRDQIENELNEIAASLIKKEQSGVLERRDSLAMDYYLYFRDDLSPNSNQDGGS